MKLHEPMYCIECEQIVNEDIHLVTWQGEYGLDWDWCDGVLTTCPPPEITEEEWEAIFAQEDSAFAEEDMIMW
jgi:hypothetical protein